MLLTKAILLGSVLLKGSDWGSQLYRDCPMQVSVDWQLPKIKINQLSFSCAGDQDKMAFGSSVGPYDFEVRNNEEVYFENKKVGFYLNKRFEVTFTNQYEERVYLKLRPSNEESQSFNAIWSVDSFDYPSFDAWTESSSL